MSEPEITPQPLTNYRRGVFWGEIDRLAGLPVDTKDAWRSVRLYRTDLAPEVPADFERGYADAYAGTATFVRSGQCSK